MNKNLLVYFLFFLLLFQNYSAQCWWKHDSSGFGNLAIKKDGTLWAWGWNNIGQLGVGNTVNQWVPMQIGTDKDWKEISWGYHHALAIKNNGTLWAWGWNRDGQLGDGTYIDRTTPQQIGSDTNWKMVAAGFSHSVALKTDGSVWAWGMNDFGQIGNNSYVHKIPTPTRAGLDNDWVHISAGEETVLAIKSNGTLWGWGNNVVGQIGGGIGSQRVPTQKGTETDWKTAEAGTSHSFAIKNNGTLWAFGNNQYGQLGDGTLINRSAPIQIGTDTNWKQVVPGIQHSVGLKTDGSLWTWGDNSFSQLGDGTSTNKIVPTMVVSSGNWESLGTYLNTFNSVLKNDGTIWTFGHNSFGNLGDGTTIDKNYPVLVNSASAQMLAITQSAPAICGTTPVVLTSSLPTGNIWSTGATTQSITVISPGTYSVTNPNSGCVTSASVTIQKDEDPNLSISGPTDICEGVNAILTASVVGQVSSYSWSNGANTPSITISTGGVYTVTVTTPGGCQYSKSISVQTDSSINISIATPAQITCNTSQITLNASASTFSAGANVLWTATNGGTILSGANSLTPIVSTAGTYTLKITNSTALACSKELSVTVTVDKTPPVVTLNATKTTICAGDSVVITATGAATYNWNNLPGTGNTQTVSPNTTTTYSVTGVGANGCSSVVSTITINVIPDISISLPKNILFCPGESINLNADAGPNHSYLWNNGATTPNIIVNAPGNYSVTVTNAGCSKTFYILVNEIKLPEIKEIKYQDGTLIVDAINFGNTPLEYSIDGGLTWYSSNIFSNVPRNTNHIIKVRNFRMGCDTEIEFFTHFIPNTITPNSDGFNDKIDFTSIANQKQFSGVIVNRYGHEIFKIKSGAAVWNGQYLGKPLPTDTYWYKLNWVDSISGKPIHFKGWVLLKNRD